MPDRGTHIGGVDEPIGCSELSSQHSSRACTPKEEVWWGVKEQRLDSVLVSCEHLVLGERWEGQASIGITPGGEESSAIAESAVEEETCLGEVDEGVVHGPQRNRRGISDGPK